MDTSNAYPHGCPFPPGSLEKVAVLTERARLRMPLFVEGDAVDCNARASRGGHSRKPRQARRPELWRRLGELTEWLRFGMTYRAAAKRLHCSVGQIGRMAEHAERKARGQAAG